MAMRADAGRERNLVKILHLAPDPESSNGIGAYASAYREALALAGLEVVSVSSDRDARHSVADVRAYRALAEQEVCRGYDIVHAELGGRALREFYALRRIHARTQVRTVATLHDPPGAIWWPFHVDLVRQSRVLGAAVRLVGSAAAGRLERQAITGLDAVFTLSTAGAHAVAGSYGPSVARRTEVLAYPHRPGRVRDRGSPASGERGPLMIGFFGYWYEGKGLLRLVDALALCRRAGVDVRARLWGDVSRDAGLRVGRRYRQRVLDAIAEHQLGPVVEVPGFLAPDAVADSLAACDVIVLPYETSAVTASVRSTSAAMFEAFAAGVPVIASDVKALSEEVRDGENGLLVPATDTAALAAAFARLSRDRGLLERLHQGAAERARSLDLARCGVAAAAAYRRVLEQA